MTRRSIYDKDTIDPFSCSTRSCVLCPAYLLRTGLVDVQDDGIGKDSMNMPIISSLLLLLTWDVGGRIRDRHTPSRHYMDANILIRLYSTNHIYVVCPCVEEEPSTYYLRTVSRLLPNDGPVCSRACLHVVIQLGYTEHTFRTPQLPR
jgi:hypothetical protein